MPVTVTAINSLKNAKANTFGKVIDRKFRKPGKK